MTAGFFLKVLQTATLAAVTAAAATTARTLARRLTDDFCDRVLNGERSGPAGAGSADLSLR